MIESNKSAIKSTETHSTWQQWMVDAGSAAGSTAAVISEESMKCLKYCIHWLQYAIQHIQQQMNLIRNYLVSLATTNESQPSILDSIKKEMVSTIRKVIDVITCYASTALPYQAKKTIRGTILTLPTRWATLNDPKSSYKQEDVALKLLTFGQESGDMLGSIQIIFDDTLQRAESWLKSIQSLSIPLIQHIKLQSTNTKEEEDLPPIQNLHLS
jgi:hypothetical protein